MVMTYSHTKVQCQQPVSGNKRTDGQTERKTEASALLPSVMRSVIIFPLSFQTIIIAEKLSEDNTMRALGLLYTPATADDLWRPV